MSKPKIIYLSEVVFSPHMCNVFGVAALKNAGFNVELIEFSAALHPEYSKQQTIEVDNLFSNVRKFSKLNDVISAIANEKRGSIFILFMWFRLKTWPLFKVLSTRNHTYGLQLQNCHPSPGYKELPLSRTIFKVLSKPNLIVEKMFNKTPLRLLGIKPANFYIAGGLISANHRLIGKHTEIVWTSAHDYGVYIDELSEKENLIKGKYVVFLDEYWPYHEDWVLIGKQLITPEKYYPKMCELFDYVEASLGCKVIIAAHPRSKYEDKPGIYGERTIIKGKTVKLVKNAQLVIAHDSLSLNFANLFEKPVLFTKFDFDPYFDGEVVPDAMAEAFGKKAISLDLEDTISNINISVEMLVNIKAYTTYRNNFIVTKQGMGRKNWEIVSNYLQKVSCSEFGDDVV